MTQRRAVATLVVAVLSCAVVLSLPTAAATIRAEEDTTTSEPTAPPTAPTSTEAPTTTEPPTTTEAPPPTEATTTVPPPTEAPATTILPTTTEPPSTTTLPTTTTEPPSLASTSTIAPFDFEGARDTEQDTPDLTNLLRVWAASIVIVVLILVGSWWSNRS